MSVLDSETVLLITRNGMGEAEPALQQKLAGTFFNLLKENNILPAAICFYTEGVRLAVAGSPVLDSLKALETKVEAYENQFGKIRVEGDSSSTRDIGFKSG